MLYNKNHYHNLKIINFRPHIEVEDFEHTSQTKKSKRFSHTRKKKKKNKHTKRNKK